MNRGGFHMNGSPDIIHEGAADRLRMNSSSSVIIFKKGQARESNQRRVHRGLGTNRGTHGHGKHPYFCS